MSKLPFERLGPYRITRAVGSGGMGSVFLGVDEESGQQAAVKLLSPALAANESFRMRFGTEIETLKKLKHPNIVQLLGYGEQDGQLFYVMEYVEGRTLHEELRSGRRFPWREAARLGVEICQALKHAHDRGVVHRDLKPANLIYTPEEHVKLLDFGIAKLYGMSQVTVVGGVIGTVDFMSPEQAEGRAITARSDLYSLGAVLFTLLCGRPPFTGRSVPEIMRMLRYDDPPAVRSLAPDTPDEFELIVAQLLRKEPQQRIATPLAVANRLKAMEYALSVETRVAPLPDQEPLADEDEYSLEPPAGSLPTQATAGSEAAAEAGRDAGIDDESLRKHQRSTLAMSDLYDAEEADEAAPSNAASSTHFTTYDEAARQRELQSTEADDSVAFWLKIAPLAAAIILVGGGVWYFTRPPSADDLYEQIRTVAEQDEPRQLADVEHAMDRFLQSFPADPRQDAVRSWQEDLKLYRLQKQYETRARFRRRNESLSAVERAYLSAIRLAGSNPGAAARKLEALLDVFSDAELDRSAQQCLKLATEQLEQLRARAAELAAQQAEQLLQRLDAADQLESTDPARANAIRQGIVELYGQEAWAESIVARARRALAP